MKIMKHTKDFSLDSHTKILLFLFFLILLLALLILLRRENLSIILDPFY